MRVRAQYAQGVDLCARDEAQLYAQLDRALANRYDGGMMVDPHARRAHNCIKRRRAVLAWQRMGVRQQR